MRLLLVALSLGAVLLAAPSVVAQPSTETAEVVQRGGQKFSVAVAPVDADANLRNGPAVAAEVVEVLEGDLAFTGWFAPVANRGFIEAIHKADQEAGALQYSEWRALAQLLIKTKAEPAEGGRLTLTFSLVDPNQARELLARRYTGNPELLRQLAHRFSDDVYEYFSRRKGICSTRIAFVQRTAKGSELCVMDYDGKGVLQKTFDNSQVVAPAWSPDGRYIVFSSLRGGYWDVYRLNLASGQVDKLVAFPGINTQAEYSPDGQELVLILSKTGNPEVFTYHLRTGALKRLTYTSAVENSPSFSPDGKSVLYSSDGTGRPHLHLLNLADPKEPVRLTRMAGYNDMGEFSPDGKKIVFASSAGGSFNIYTISPDGSDVTQLTQGGGNKESPSWSPDGEFICYAGNQLGRYNIYVMRADGTETRRITYLQGEALMPAWSPYLR